MGGQHPAYGVVVDVRDDHRRAVGDRVLGEQPADLADAGDADGAPGQSRCAPKVLGAGPHALVDPERGQHRGVAGPSRRLAAPGHEVALGGDDVHVRDVRADVARCDVATAERLDETAIGAQQVRRLEDGRVADDDRFAAAVVEPGQRVLVGHGPGQLEHVCQRVVVAGVGVEARSAQGRAEGGVVDRDDGAQPGGLVVTERHLFVAEHVGGGAVEDIGGQRFRSSGRVGSSGPDRTNQDMSGRQMTCALGRSADLPRCRVSPAWDSVRRVPGHASW